MENTLAKIETEEVIIYRNYCYSNKVLLESKKYFNELKLKGIINGTFEDEQWLCYSGVRKFGIRFSFDKNIYEEHIGKEFGISYDTMQKMIKCYALYSMGQYILQTISRERVNVIKEFLCNYSEKNLNVKTTELYYIEEFLAFINTPDAQIDEIVQNVSKVKNKPSGVRELSPLINYLVIENEINRLYNNPIMEEEFIKFFPIYFWVNITFILPLRATEMLVTPFDCIEFDDNDIVLRVRRTTLKSGKKKVYYDVENDYEIFTYHLKDIINRKVFDNIKRYQEITKHHNRRFLFEYGHLFSNEMLSLRGFNELIKLFMDEKIKDNPLYEFAKKVSGIDEFEYVTAGDSRPIAMANLWYQDAGADICRQLANHMKISTSEGYYTNVSNTLYFSSIMQMQNRLNEEYNKEIKRYSELVVTDEYGCSNPKRITDKTNIEDCSGHYEDCFGCKYYFPNDKQINEYMDERKAKFEANAKKMQQVLNSTNKIKGKDIDMNEIFLKVHTTCVRYKESTDVFAEKEAKKWVEQQNSQKIYC